MDWNEGPVAGCQIDPLTYHTDERGWLTEFFRHDELDENLHPLMGYISLTHPGIVRGPHEHRDQTDLFVFFTGTFKLYLWDNREESSTYGHRQTRTVGEDDPVRVIVPPGIVHAYQNIGTEDALLINCPNRLYGGWNREAEVDEIRHEERPESPFTID